MKCEGNSKKSYVSGRLSGIYLVIYDKGKLHCFSRREWARKAKCTNKSISRRLDSPRWTDRQAVGIDPPPVHHKIVVNTETVKKARRKTMKAKTSKPNPPRTAMHNFLTAPRRKQHD